MPNMMQQFRLWRDYGGQNPGLLGSLSRWNEFTGERRAAYINHSFISAIEGLCCATLFITFSVMGIVNPHVYFGLVTTFVVIGLVHVLIMLKRREAYFQLKIRERQALRQKSDDNFKDLANYAEGVRKGYVS